MTNNKTFPELANISLALRITSFDGVTPRVSAEVPAGEAGSHEQVFIENSTWDITYSITPVEGRTGGYESRATFKVLSGRLSNANVGVRIDFSDWSRDNYIIMPAAVYAGNRFRVIPVKYPPMIHEEDGIGPDMPVTITDVPHLASDGSGSRIHLRSGDMATPCIGVRMAQSGKGMLLLSEHDTPLGYTGIMLDESPEGRKAFIQLEAPAVRETRYLWNNNGATSDDEGHDFAEGDVFTLTFRLYCFDCPDIPALFAYFCNIRKDLSGDAELLNALPFSRAFGIIEKKYNEYQWNGKDGHYMLAPYGDNPYWDWQAGWCGGGMNSYALLMDGGPLSKERGITTMNSVFSEKLQAPTGFIYPMKYQGKLLGDDFAKQDRKDFMLLRKDADLFIFASRHIMLLQKRGEEVPQSWIAGIRRLADAFVRLWRKYGQFGQFIDLAKEEIVLGGTASAGIAPGGLALAYKMLGDQAYLDAAVESAAYYYDNYLVKGILNGGPGEILQGCDSESAFGLLESFVTLFEVTGDRSWLPKAEDCARQCASWCVSYDFHFPEGTEFNRLDMRTTGSVFANVQNKHSAPGICTLSGVSLLKLYRATGNAFYLELCREIAHNVNQYLSREDRPIMSWDGKALPAGWMCERVNMCDWETKKCIGGVFKGSCWCEISCLFTYNDIPGIWFLTDTGEAVVFDHVDAEVSRRGDSWHITIKNPTAFDAAVKIYAEPRSGFDKAWGECTLEGCSVVNVPAGGKAEYTVKL